MCYHIIEYKNLHCRIPVFLLDFMRKIGFLYLLFRYAPAILIFVSQLFVNKLSYTNTKDIYNRKDGN